MIISASFPVRHASAWASLAAARHSNILRPLMVINLVLIVIHLIVATSPTERPGSWSDFLRIDHDRSVSEWFESAELGVAALLLTIHDRRYRYRCYRMMAALLVIMLIDNLVELRTHAAALLAPGQNAVAELALVMAAAPFVAGIAYFAYLRAEAKERRGLAAMFVVLAVFALFAVATDFLHEAVRDNQAVYAALSVVEEAGELITLSVLLVLIVHLTRRVPTGSPHEDQA